jgi:hypothetical protein
MKIQIALGNQGVCGCLVANQSMTMFCFSNLAQLFNFSNKFIDRILNYKKNHPRVVYVHLNKAN